jgi:hypothetical protein
MQILDLFQNLGSRPIEGFQESVTNRVEHQFQLIRPEVFSKRPPNSVLTISDV